MLLTGIVAGAVPSNSPMPICFLAFMTPIVLAVTITLLFQDKIAYQVLALLTLIFAAQMFSASHKFSNNLVSSLRSQLENQELAEQLSATNDRLQSEVSEHEKAGDSLQFAIQKLWDSNTLFNQAEEIGNLGHWEWDEIASCYITCSEQYANICGMTVEEVLGVLNTSKVTTRLSPMKTVNDTSRSRQQLARTRNAGTLSTASTNPSAGKSTFTKLANPC